MEHNTWISTRQAKELERRERIEIFDKFVDLAIDKVVTVDQAIVGYKEMCEQQGISLSSEL